jgi:hypothetical protein
VLHQDFIALALPAAPARSGARTRTPRPANASAVANGFECATLDPTFVATGYLGAFDPNAASWLTAPWISLAAD